MKQKRPLVLRHEYKFKVPAKINHYLKILEKRPGGRHNLILDFFPISLTDEIQIEPAHAKKLTVMNSELSSGKGDIVYKMIEAVEEFCDVQFYITVKIKKNIPIGSGLGGGSANAGGLLIVLNRIFELGLAAHNLFDLALSVGSDVPFFLHRKPGIYKYGEDKQLKRFRHMPKDIALIVPNFQVSTHEAFKAVAPHINNEKIDYLSFDYRQWSLHDVGINDFWNVKHPYFEKLKNLRTTVLGTGFDAVYMTGTGSTLYALCEENNKFNRAYANLINIPELTVIRSNTMNDFPLIIH